MRSTPQYVSRSQQRARGLKALLAIYAILGALALAATLIPSCAKADSLTIIRNDVAERYIGKVAYLSMDEGSGGIEFTAEANPRPAPVPDRYPTRTAPTGWTVSVNGTAQELQCVGYVSIDNQSAAPSAVVLICE